MSDTAPVTSMELKPVADYMMSSTEAEAIGRWGAAELVLQSIFKPSAWTVAKSVNSYGPGAHANLFNVEVQRDFREWLGANHVSVEEYSAAVGQVQYVSIQIQLASVLKEVRNNRGWRISLMGFPSLGLLAVGLASHYQGTQNHNQMGRASSLLHDSALEVLSGNSSELIRQMPSATSEEWEERGLMSEPILRVGTLDISTFDAGLGAKLRMIRNTTVKIELATFFAVRGLTVNDFVGDAGRSLIVELRNAAVILGSPKAVTS